MDWIPIAFVTFKVLAFGTCMFFAIKWHYDKEQSEKGKRAALRAALTVAPVLVLLLLAVGLLAAFLIRMLGLDMKFP